MVLPFGCLNILILEKNNLKNKNLSFIDLFCSSGSWVLIHFWSLVFFIELCCDGFLTLHYLILCPKTDLQLSKIWRFDSNVGPEEDMDPSSFQRTSSSSCRRERLLSSHCSSFMRLFREAFKSMFPTGLLGQVRILYLANRP